MLCSSARTLAWLRRSAAVCFDRQCSQGFNRHTSSKVDVGEEVLRQLVNYEQQGIPKDAGTQAHGHFDVGRMHRLLGRMGDPHKQWPVLHVAGSKGSI